MNRIKLSPLATDSLCDTRQNATQTLCGCDTFEINSQPASGHFSLFVPMHYEKNYAYPLVVWLHSDGQDSDQVQKVMLEMSMRNYVGVSPRAPQGSHSVGYFWDQDFDTIEESHEAVMNAIDTAAVRFNIATNRIFLAGMGSGGTMAFRIAFERPEIFAGVMSINGPVPERTPLRDWSRCRELPVFWAHGRQSTAFNQDQLCEQLRLLHVAGFSVTLRQYPHSDLLCQNTMSDMNRWAMEMISTAIIDRHPR